MNEQTCTLDEGVDPLTKGRILIAEDDQDVAQTIVEGLESMQYSVVNTVPYGENLQAEVEQHKPDLLIVDIYLAGNMDGIEATLPIAAKQDLPIIFLSGNFSVKLIERLREHHDAMLLYKPCKIPELAANIEIALKRRNKGEKAFTDLFSQSTNMESIDFRQQLGQLIKTTRKDYKLTQANAAEKLSINYRYYQDIEAGKANLKIDTLFKILKGLNLID
jgi:DNA-binding response OmpR family regulator